MHVDANMLLHYLAALIALLAGCDAAVLPSADIHVLHERRTANAWSKRDKLDANHILPVRIGLKQKDLDRGMDLLMDV